MCTDPALGALSAVSPCVETGRAYRLRSDASTLIKQLNRVGGAVRGVLGEGELPWALRGGQLHPWGATKELSKHLNFCFVESQPSEGATAPPADASGILPTSLLDVLRSLHDSGSRYLRNECIFRAYARKSFSMSRTADPRKRQRNSRWPLLRGDPLARRARHASQVDPISR